MSRQTKQRRRLNRNKCTVWGKQWDWQDCSDQYSLGGVSSSRGEYSAIVTGMTCPKCAIGRLTLNSVNKTRPQEFSDVWF